MSYKTEGPGIEYAGYRFGLFEKYQRGEIEIKTTEDVEKVLKICSWIIFHINRGVDTTIRADSENAPVIKRGEKITKEEVKAFMKNKKFERINHKAYFSYVKKDELLPIVRKWEEEIEKKEKKLVEGEISFSKFKIILDAFHKATDELGFEKYCYRAQEKKTIEIFNKKGFYATKDYGPLGSLKNLRGFKKTKEEEKPSSSSSLITSKKKLYEYEPPKELLEKDFRDLPIRDKVIWGIGPKAITLVNEVGYSHDTYHRRYPIGKKVFFNYKRKPEESEKLAKEILERYGE